MAQAVETSRESESLLGDFDDRVSSPSKSPSNTIHQSAFDAANIKLLACLFIATAMVDLGNFMIEVPLVKLLESLVCRDYYSDELLLLASDIDEQQCKIPPIQKEVATLISWNQSLNAIPGLFTAVFYGTLADKYGRKPIIMLAYTGVLLAQIWLILICFFHARLPLRIIWISSVFHLIGGGERVVSSMVYTMLSDAIKQPKRTNVLYWLFSIMSFASFIAPPIGVELMKRNIWLPWIVAISLWVSAYPLIYSMRETLVFRDVSPPSTPRSSTDSPLSPLPPEHRSVTTMTRLRKLITTNFKVLLIPNLIYCFIVFSIQYVGAASRPLVPQYASIKYRWALKDTGWLTSLQPLGRFIVTAFILPSLTTFILSRNQITAVAVDLNVVKGSLLLQCFGMALLWAAETPIIMILGLILEAHGEGVAPALQSIATSLVNPEQTARMFTTVAFLEGCGTIVGRPLMAAIFSAGLDASGPVWARWSLGGCFLVASVLYGLSAVAAWRVRFVP